ncbi:MAG: hypothetical protein ACYDAE_12640 [Steroidobacteraceae bacterium]
MSEDTPGESGHREGHEKIPMSVMVIACLYLAVGIGGSIAHFHALRAPDGIWIELTECVAIVCGVFLLRAHNWARWLAIAWMAFHVAISFGALRQLAIHGIFLILIAWFLLRPEASRFFQGSRLA